MKASSTKQNPVYTSLVLVLSITIVMGVTSAILFTIFQEHSLSTLLLRDACTIIVAFFIMHLLIKQYFYSSLDKVQDLNRTVQNIQDYVFKLRRNEEGEMVFTFAEGKLATQRGETTASVYGKTLAEMSNKELAQRLEPYYEQAFKGATVNYEFTYPDMTLHTTLSPIFEKGKVVEVVGVSSDITPLRKMEQKLEEREQQILNILESIAEGFCTIDRQQRFTFINKQGATWLNRTREDIVGKYVNEIIPEAIRRSYIPYYKRAIKEQSPVRFETFLYHRWLEVRIYPTRDSFYVYFDDITEKKQAEQMVRTTDKLAVVGQLAAGVAHEIRNPLTSIRGFLQLLTYKNDPETIKYVNVMLSDLDRIELVISEFLILAKPQAVHKQAHSVETLMRQAIDLLKTKLWTRHIRYDLQVEPSLPPVECEHNQLIQAFLNIMKNGIEAMPEGGQLRIEIKKKHGSDEQILVQIQDQGVGIPRELLSRLGEPFMTTKDRGTGLGLTVSYKIIQNHRGQITVQSEQGKGTTFTILLPTSQAKSSP